MLANTEEVDSKEAGKTNKKKLPIIILITLIMVIIAGLGWAYGYPDGFLKIGGFVVTVDDQEIGVVTQKESVEAVIKQLVKEHTPEDVQRDVKPREEIKIKRTWFTRKNEVLSEISLKEVLQGKLTYMTLGTGIVIDGDEKVIVANEEKAREVLSLVKGRFRPPETGIKLQSLVFREKVGLLERETPVEKITGTAEAVELLINGPGKMVVHTVEEGETLWDIARNNDLWVEDLQKANPQLSSITLQIGQQLKLIKSEPMLHVVATYNQEITEQIPYAEEFVTDASLMRGTQCVRQEGSSGEKKISYRIKELNGAEIEREVVGEQILKEPVNKVVARGTKLMLASRGGGGSLGWPLRGTITSRYGYRGQEFHTGLDIDGVTGQPVYAAESGKVVYTGWRGNYGRMLVIDHGGGLETRYAHLSAFKVRVGDTVSRGETVALVGSTGRSTGSHLHFEVMVRGNFIDPLKALR